MRMRGRSTWLPGLFIEDFVLRNVCDFSCLQMKKLRKFHFLGKQFICFWQAQHGDAVIMGGCNFCINPRLIGCSLLSTLGLRWVKLHPLRLRLHALTCHPTQTRLIIVVSFFNYYPQPPHIHVLVLVVCVHNKVSYTRVDSVSYCRLSWNCDDIFTWQVIVYKPNQLLI